MMSLTDLRSEFLEPTFRPGRTLLPFLAECVLAAATTPTRVAYLEAGERLRKSKSPLADCINTTFLKWAWGCADEDDIVVRWVRLHGEKT